jgi:hypothetical protein
VVGWLARRGPPAAAPHNPLTFIRNNRQSIGPNRSAAAMAKEATRIRRLNASNWRQLALLMMQLFQCRPDNGREIRARRSHSRQPPLTKDAGERGGGEQRGNLSRPEIRTWFPSAVFAATCLG